MLDGSSASRSVIGFTALTSIHLLGLCMDLLWICLFAFFITTIHSIEYLDHITTNSTHDFILRGFRNDAIYSLNGIARIVMQSDGNLVISSRISTSSNWNTVWETNTFTTASQTSYFAIQRDGHLLVYFEEETGENNEAAWSS